MIATAILGTLYVLVKILATLISLWVGLRKLLRWLRRRAKRKPPV